MRGRRVLFLVLLVACEQRPLSLAPAPPPAAARVFFDDFEGGQPAQWDPLVGDWEVDQRRYLARGRDFALTVAGAPGWSDYQVSAQVTIDDDRDGPVGLAARVQSTHYHYELLLGRQDGAKGWMIRRRRDHSWTILASGPADYRIHEPQVLRLVVD